MKIFTLFLVSILFIGNGYTQGLIFDTEASKRIRQNYRVQQTRSLYMPSNYSLEKYTPYVFNQGDSDMCTAYSLALARTIVYARNNNLTNKNKISAEAYSPYYIYSKYKSSTDGYFEGGLDMYFNKLNDFGYAKMKEIEYPHYYPFTEKQLWNFAVPSYLNLDHEYIKAEKFDEINCIYVEDSSIIGRTELVNLVKSEIIKEKPVIFGMNLYNTFPWSEDYWSDTITTWCDFITNEGEYCTIENSNQSGKCHAHEPADYYSGHAMTLIGYDDDKHGGAFLIQNSWGKDSHNEGKVWIPYDVFARNATYIQSLDKKPKTEFEKVDSSHDFNYSSKEINFDIKDFSNVLDLNWILFTALTVEEIKANVNDDGQFSLPNNLRIRGSIHQNLLEGEGEINLNNRYTYKGQFKSGNFNGKGLLVKYDKWGDVISSREGDFDNGNFIDGTVKELINCQDPDDPRQGCTYAGSFKNGNYNGAGVLSHNQFDVYIDGIFVDGFPIKGKISVKSWYLYEGEINQYLLPHGKGILIEEGIKTEGVFEYGKLVK